MSQEFAVVWRVKDSPRVLQDLTKERPIPKVFHEMWYATGSSISFDPEQKLALWQELNHKSQVNNKKIGYRRLIMLVLAALSVFLIFYLPSKMWFYELAIFSIGASTLFAVWPLAAGIEISKRMREIERQINVYLEWLKDFSYIIGLNGSLTSILSRGCYSELSQLSEDMLLELAKKQIVAEHELEVLNRTEKFALKEAAERAIEAQRVFERRLENFRKKGLGLHAKGVYLARATDKIREETAARHVTVTLIE